MLLRLSYNPSTVCIVRVERLTIRSIKCVEHGEVLFNNPHHPDGPRIVGLYGENGSGKSTFIDVLGILKQCMSGKHIDGRMAQYIDVDADVATIECEFDIRIGEGTFSRAIYALAISRDTSAEGTDDVQSVTDRVRICSETLSLSAPNLPEFEDMTTVIDTSVEPVFGPPSSLERLVGLLADADCAREIPVPTVDLYAALSTAKQEAYKESRSLLFSRELYESILTHRHDLVVSANDGQLPADGLPQVVATSLSALSRFAQDHMHILDAAYAGNAIAGTLVLPAVIHDLSTTIQNQEMMKESVSHVFPVDFDFPIDGPAWVNKFAEQSATRVLEIMNPVISQVISGLTISIEQVGTNEANRPKLCKYLRMMSHRNGKTIPFTCESSGVKRIFSLVNLLVLIYDDPRAFVAIDELDAGIFENLLGELLSCVASDGMGQLVFTSNHLQPLEPLDNGYIRFTTTNPMNRYVGVNDGNINVSLRDSYYGNAGSIEQSERLHESIDIDAISRAFKKAAE